MDGLDAVDCFVSGVVLGSSGGGSNNKGDGSDDGCMLVLMVPVALFLCIGGCVSKCHKGDETEARNNKAKQQATQLVEEKKREHKEEAPKEGPSKWEKTKKVIHALTE